ncbi:hypothetical protein FACS189456_1850 [Bacteroidia bacterium]|nr:hypothetical protein FACS189456_1850 [Bacteroidia bacterium]
MAFELLKHIKFYLLGGLPSASRYEQKRTRIREQHKRYEVLHESDAMKRYRELATQTATPRNQSGLPKKEWKQLKRELTALRKNADVVQFFKLQKGADNFKELTSWEEFFYEDFQEKELDPIKWIVQRPSFDERLPNIQYSLAEENHLFAAEAKNLQLTGHSLQIFTKKEPEPAEGVVFSNEFGFVPAQRNFTSGIISTGENCKLLYGKIEAKVKFFSSSKYVFHAIWMAAGGRLPHINILRKGSKLEFSSFAQNKDKTQQHADLWSAGTLRQNTYYIVQLIWNKDRIEWYINGKKMFSAPNTIHEPMFLTFSSGVLGGNPRSETPSVFEIDWVSISSPCGF